MTQHRPRRPGTNGRDAAVARAALAQLAGWRAHDRHEWITVGMALHAVDDALLPDWIGWSRSSAKFEAGACERAWSSFTRGGGIGLGTLVYKAAEDSGGRLLLGHQRQRPACKTSTTTLCWDPLPDLSAEARAFERRLDVHHLRANARELGVGADSLRRLRAGHDGQALTFPMRDELGQVIGIRRRLPNGRKLAVRGGREGMFMPRRLDRIATIFLAEGPTDTAALLDLGFEAVGRPSAKGAMDVIAAWVLSRKIRRVVVVADADPAGTAGGAALARRLAPLAHDVRMIVPPSKFKDVREWVRAGANATTIAQRVRRGMVFRIRVTVGRVR